MTRRLVLALLFLLGSATLCRAHELGQSYIFLRIFDHSIEARLEITADDLSRILDLNWNLEDGLTREEIGANIDSILSYVNPRFHLGTAQGLLRTRFVDSGIRRLEKADYVLLNFIVENLDEIPRHLEVEFPVFFEIDSDHRNLLVVEQNWKTATFNNESGVSLIFGPRSPRQTLDLTSNSVLRGFAALVRMGTWHIWIGLDHILFLLALVLPSVLYRVHSRWEPVESFPPAMINIVAIVSFFTIAHSITLSLAALEIVQLPSRLVESIIAASIAVAALHNIFPRLDVRGWIIAFVFGLFHGFGFAGILTDLGLHRDHLVLSLLGFNLGVEIGQVAIIGLVFPVLYLIRKENLYPRILKYGSALLIFVAMFWFFERALDLSIYGYARRTAGSLLRMAGVI
jgi:hypothetical protein